MITITSGQSNLMIGRIAPRAQIFNRLRPMNVSLKRFQHNIRTSRKCVGALSIIRRAICVRVLFLGMGCEQVIG